MATASARRYARAVFDVAQESGEIEAWTTRLQELRRLLGNPDVRNVVNNPSIPASRREQAVAAVAPASLGKEGLNLAKLLVGNGKAGAIEGIVEEFERLSDEAAGRIQATATTAVELSADERERIAGQLSRSLGKEVRLRVRVDPAIIGGLVLQFGDRLLDASVATRLSQLRRRLTAV